jgi:DNA topoisomerase-6 subunit A
VHGNRLSEDKFWRRYNCVLLTANGQLPRGVRRLARCLREEYKIRVYVFVDNDPWGYYIYSVVKQGSINLPRTVGIKLNDKLPRKLKEKDWLD